MADSQNQGNSYWQSVGQGAMVEGVSTLAEQGIATLGTAGVAYGVSKIGGHFSPTLGTRSGVLSRGLVGGFKAGHGSVGRVIGNYGMNIGLSALVGGYGLHLLESNNPHNKINSNEAINNHPTLMSAAGGAIAGAAFAGVPMAAGMKIAGGELGEIIGSKSISNYLDKRGKEILNDKNLTDMQRQDATEQLTRYREMNAQMHEANENINGVKKRLKGMNGQSKKNVKEQLSQMADERNAAAFDVAKQARKSILGDSINGFLENTTDKWASKLYHMKGRSAAIVGGSMLLGAAVGAGHYASQNREGA